MVKKMIYDIGEEITYKGELYYTLVPSSHLQDYVTLLKAEPLKSKDIKDIIVGTEVADIVNLQGTYVTMPYFTSHSCRQKLILDCRNDYLTSDIKKIVDMWSNSKLISNNLKEVNDYKVRLLSFEETITYLGYTKKSGSPFDYAVPSQLTPNWIYSSNYDYWTMSPYVGEGNLVWVMNSNGYLDHNAVFYQDYYTIRPVINLKKSEIKEDL